MSWADIGDCAPRQVSEGFRVWDIWQGVDGSKAQVVDIAPGACYPEVEVHAPGPEEVYVVSGVFNDGERDYPAGSFIHCPAGSAHVPQSRLGCRLFLFYPQG
jgi:quercetin dioxygenase-like cupin family protein